MNYTIFSIDDSRKSYTDAIRAQLSGSFWFEERKTTSCNANDPHELEYFEARHRYQLNWQAGGAPRKGHLGVWYSVLTAIEWTSEPIVTFEDDAILHPDFNRLFWEVTSHLPKDTDVFALFLPRDQDYKASHSTIVGPGVLEAYQKYGGVSMLWTPYGAAKFRKLLRRDGIMDQWDNQLFEYGRAGEMNVYTQYPNANVLVSISGTEDSIVQESDML